MPAGKGNGYVSSYVGAVAPIAASIVVVVIPLAIYTRDQSAELELGGLFFALLAIVAVVGGILLVPVGIYLALTMRGHRMAGRTAWAVVVVALVFLGFTIVVQLIGEAVVAGSVPADVATTLFVLGLLVAPFLARWYVVRFPKTQRQGPQARDMTASGG
jgi:uncharacterized membrane protein